MKQRNKTHAQAGLYKMNRLHRVFGIARLLILISMIAAPLMPRQGQLAQLDLPLADLAKVLAPDEAAAQTAAPGGVSGGLQLWLKADAGVTGSPSVSAWNDQTGNNRHVIENTTAFQPTLVAASAASNFNPSISFDGVNDNLVYKGVRFMPTSSSGTLMGAGSNKLDSGGYENFADLGIDNPHMGLYDDAGSFTDQIMWMNGSAPVQILHPTKLQGNKTQVYGYYWNGGSPNVGSGMRLDGSDFFEPTTEATFVGSSGTSDGMFSVGSTSLSRYGTATSTKWSSTTSI